VLAFHIAAIVRVFCISVTILPVVLMARSSGCRSFTFGDITNYTIMQPTVYPLLGTLPEPSVKATSVSAILSLCTAQQ